MQQRTARELRELFLSFWEEKGSSRLSSFSLVPDDPSLLFTIAGMVPLKPYYLGIKEPPHPRVVTSQKCVRTNDIENVGRTARHHTFFEMLGNFTWGSYFKKEAIAWAWEFLTERVGLEPDRLWATIYLDDNEAFEAWRKAGLPEDRILRCGQDENYWFMGDTGPCGPCSEIYYDRGEKYSCGKPTCGVGCDCDRYLEIWNLVFTQFDRQKDGSLPLLPHKNIDTGMGLERLAMVVQGVDTDYETDIFTPLIQHTCKRAGIRYHDGNAKNDMAVRVISDHVRAVAFMLADGVLPSNDGPGYVLRRLLRRAVRFGKLLGFDGPFLCEYLPILIDLMGEPYRELITQRPTVEQIITVEEERFQKTLQQGTDLFEEAVKGLSAGGCVPGDVAFTLYDTYGFPPELTREMAEEKGLTVDEEGFAAAMEGQRQRARASSKQKHSALAGDVYTELENEFGPTCFTGYETAADTGKIIALLTADGRVDKIDQAPKEFELVLDTTPFYAERGGEVGDTGRMTVGNAALEVLNTVPHGGIIVHTVRLAEIAGPATIAVGEPVSCQVNEERRSAIRRNHTSTHLLHEALGRVLGRHVRQAGSLVADEFLRFDFTHHSPMSEAEIEEVERIVNRQILANTPVTTKEYSRDEAQKLGARALFEEKYGEVVRVVTVPENNNETFSMELCGGLHVRATGDIGSFKILREESVGSGTRRILATTGMNVLVVLQKLFGLRSAMTALLSTDEEGLKEKAQGLVDDLRRMKNELQAVKLRELTENTERFLERREVGGVLLQVGRFPNVKPDVLREVGDKAKARPEPTVVVLASVGDDESCQLVVMADDRAVKLGANAGALVKEASAILGGKGGGRPSTAQGGGKDGAKLDEALARIEALVKEQVKA